jgi:hypothetical protein
MRWSIVLALLLTGCAAVPEEPDFESVQAPPELTEKAEAKENEKPLSDEEIENFDFSMPFGR